MSREGYMQLLRAADPRIAALLDQGFAFVTNAFRPGRVPPGVPARDDSRNRRIADPPLMSRRQGRTGAFPMSVSPDVRVTS